MWKRKREREDYRAGLVAHMIAAVNTRKGRRPPKPMDFFKSKGSPEKAHEDTPQAARAAFLTWAMEMSRGKAILANGRNSS